MVTTMPIRNVQKCFCDFCGKSQDEIPHLVAGPGNIFICNECVKTAAEVIAEAIEKEKNDG